MHDEGLNMINYNGPKLIGLNSNSNRTAPHGGVIFALKMVKNTGIYSVL
jgi:hypothetical protein